MQRVGLKVKLNRKSLSNLPRMATGETAVMVETGETDETHETGETAVTVETAVTHQTDMTIAKQ